MAVMAKDKDKPAKGNGRKGDRHKTTPLSLRMHPLLRQQLDKLCRRNVTKLTAEIMRAVRELLAREGLWPPTETDRGAS